MIDRSDVRGTPVTAAENGHTQLLSLCQLHGVQLYVSLCGSREPGRSQAQSRGCDEALFQKQTTRQMRVMHNSLERSILDFVAGGKGLVAIHGVTMLPNSVAFDGMLGGTFDHHPPNQEVTVRTVEEDLVWDQFGRPVFAKSDRPEIHSPLGGLPQRVLSTTHLSRVHSRTQRKAPLRVADRVRQHS
jgi:hypothetical protein